MKKKKVKPAAIVATGSVSLLAMLGLYFGIIGPVDFFQKKIPIECEVCQTEWLTYVAAEGDYFRKVDKKIERYRYKKNQHGEKVCMVLGSDHIWYELLPGRPNIEGINDTSRTIDVIDPNFPSAFCDWE